MPIATRPFNMVDTFKSHINRETIPVPYNYYEGYRKTQILHTR